MTREEAVSDCRTRLNDPEDDLNYVYFYDGNGNVGQVVNLAYNDPNDPNGAIVARYEYDPYGNMTAKAGTYADTNPMRWSTKYFDAETGLSYFGGRYYHAGLGRWINRDPIEELGGQNLYAYVRNDPVDRLDYLGWALASCHGAGCPWADEPCPGRPSANSESQPVGDPPSPRKPPEIWSPEKCSALLEQIVNLANSLNRDIRQYNPADDAGGKPIGEGKGGGVTKPGGHRQALRDKQNHLKNKMDDYKNHCPGSPPLPDKVYKVKDLPIPSPVRIEPPKLWWLVDVLNKLPSDKTLNDIVVYSAGTTVVLCTGGTCWVLTGCTVTGGALIGGCTLGAATPAFAGDDPGAGEIPPDPNGSSE